MLGIYRPSLQGLAFATPENFSKLRGQFPQPQQVRALRRELIEKFLLFDGQLVEGFGDQDRRVFRCKFLRTYCGNRSGRISPRRHMPRHPAAATAIALRADFFEESCGIVTSFGPAPLQIFGKALNFRWTSSGRFALGKLSGANPAPHRFTFQVERFADLLLRTALTV